MCFGGANQNVKMKSDRITAPVEGLNGKSPYGRWILSAGVECGVKETKPQTSGDWAKKLKEHVCDIWLIVEYRAKVDYKK